LYFASCPASIIAAIAFPAYSFVIDVQPSRMAQ
jgi:hypothetical protein